MYHYIFGLYCHRRGLEHLIHSNEKMLAHVNVLNCHSRSTGEAAYLRTEFSDRGEFVNHRGKDIIESVCDDVDPESSKTSEDLMKRMDLDDATTMKQNAIELLRKEKERKNFKAKDGQEDRKYAQEVFCKFIGLDVDIKFPGN